tara:strand:+ start:3883 stop:4467 length:585 start_codon:yes stop_codon:yes gene_type:complete
MSKNDPNKIRNKWEKFELLNDLSDEMAYKISQLCENQARHLLFTHTTNELFTQEGLLEFLKNASFPMIRMVFTEETTFTFETSAVPAFIYHKPNETETTVATIHIHEFESYFTQKELDEFDNKNYYYNLDRETEKTAQLSERFLKELNEKHTGKHLIFGYPFIIHKNKDGEETVAYRCAVVEGGSKLAEGGYKE